MKILVVEDETDLRCTLGQVLREEGYAVDLAEDGREGFVLACEGMYDAIVLDVMLPIMDGWEFLRRLRQSRKTPVLILTARVSFEDRIRGLDLGSDDYVVKPFDIAELLARLRALIRRCSGEASPTIRLGAVLVDTSRKTVTYHGEPIDLTAREYALVEMLALNKGKVVTRTELYECLFSEEEEAFSNLLDVHVCNVRKKIAKDFIQTRRGQGYILEELQL